MTLFWAVVNASAIKLESGSLKELATAGRANFEVDYSNAIIHGMSEDEFALYELDWEKDQPQIIGKFLSYLNESISDQLIIVRGKKYDITLRWVVLYISENGFIKGELEVVAADGTILAKIVELNGEGGRFGSKLNLIKDGASSSGKLAGVFLKRELRKSKN